MAGSHLTGHMGWADATSRGFGCPRQDGPADFVHHRKREIAEEGRKGKIAQESETVGARSHQARF